MGGTSSSNPTSDPVLIRDPVLVRDSMLAWLVVSAPPWSMGGVVSVWERDFGLRGIEGRCPFLAISGEGDSGDASGGGGSEGVCDGEGDGFCSSNDSY